MVIETRQRSPKLLQGLRRANYQCWSRSYKFDATGRPIKINTLRFFVDEGFSKCARKASWFLGQMVMLVALLCAVSGTARASDDGGADRARRAGSCSTTSSAAFTACRHEAADTYWIAKGNCTNVSDPTARGECTLEARAAYGEKVLSCGVHRQGRQDFCAALGEAPYDPKIDPAMFVDPTQIGKAIAPNPYLLLIPGRTMVYRDGDEEIRVTITNKTRVIAGVSCREVHDVVRVNGQVIEDTLDWYAQDIHGNIWYFGEISLSYEDGVVVSIDGSWTTGVDRAKPGFAMKALPVVGESYRQEFSLNNAEDGAEVLSLTGSGTVPGGSCNNNCLITRDFSPIIPTLLEHKYFAPGVGFILEIKPKTGERLELVEIIQN